MEVMMKINGVQQSKIVLSYIQALVYYYGGKGNKGSK